MPTKSIFAIGAGLTSIGFTYSLPLLAWSGVLSLVIAVAVALRGRVPLLAKASDFIASTVSELRSCYWPSVDSVVESVKFVVWAVLLLSAYLFAIDLGATELLSWSGISKVAVSTSPEDIQ